MRPSLSSELPLSVIITTVQRNKCHCILLRSHSLHLAERTTGEDNAKNKTVRAVSCAQVVAR